MENENYNSTGIGDITINFKNLFLAISTRKFLMLKIFTCVLLFFIAITFVIPKRWKVEADLYINKSNGTNFLEANPYALEDIDGLGSMLSKSVPLVNELELIRSARVIEAVIRENNLKYKKIFGIIPTSKTGEYWTTEKFLKKDVRFENKQDTKIISLSYTSYDKDEAYNIVNSIINNYIKLYQDINSKKSKSDKAILQSEYNRAKADLNKNIKHVSGLPSSSLAGAGNLAAMSTFSRSAGSAISNIKGQYVSGEKSRIAVTESAEKVSQLAQKLEWANLVDNMSDTSKVIVVKTPHKLKSWEYASPKLLMNIIFGIIFGFIFSVIALIYKELTDDKLVYSMIGNDVVYDINNEFNIICAILLSNYNKRTAFVYFDELSQSIQEKLETLAGVPIIKASITSEFQASVKNIDNVIFIESINKTKREDYRLVKNILEGMDKKIVYEILVG